MLRRCLPGTLKATRLARLRSPVAAIRFMSHQLFKLMRKLIPSILGVTIPDWLSLGGKPATFPPSAHTHSYGTLTDIPASFVPSAHTHTYASLDGIPASFPPAVHTHAMGDVTGLAAALAGRVLVPIYLSLPPQDEVLQMGTGFGGNRDVYFRVPADKGPLAIRYEIPAGANPSPLTASLSGGVLTYRLGLGGTPGSAVLNTTANAIINLSLDGIFAPGSVPIRNLGGGDGTGIINSAMIATSLVPSFYTTAVVGQLCIVDGVNGIQQHAFVCVSASPIKWASASSSVVWNFTSQSWRIARVSGAPGSEIVTYSSF